MRGYGWLPDPEHVRAAQKRFSLVREPHIARAQAAYMTVAELGGYVRDQRGTSGCVGHAVRGAAEKRRSLDGHPHVDLSALGCYWGARAEDGFEFEDAGAFISSGCKFASTVGIPTDALWPFDEDKVNMRPSIEGEESGLVIADFDLERIETNVIESVLDALQARCPVVCGVGVTEAFEACSSDATIPPPANGDRILGGHALQLVGFDRSGERIIDENSWGLSWGAQGHGYLAAEWLLTASDIVVLRPRMSGGA